MDSSPTSLPPSTPENQRKRAAMVSEQLIPRGIKDKRVLRAMRSTPREHFMPEHMQDNAYEDRALPVGFGQTISQPYMVASMTENLAVQPADRILEIGTGTGYQTAILCQLAPEGKIWTIERNKDLKLTARNRLSEIGYTNLECIAGDGSVGIPDHAPFDRILVTAGAPDTPQALLDQLAEKGTLVIPIGGRDIQQLCRYERIQGRIQKKTLYACRFVPLIGEKGWSD